MNFIAWQMNCIKFVVIVQLALYVSMLSEMQGTKYRGEQTVNPLIMKKRLFFDNIEYYSNLMPFGRF